MLGHWAMRRFRGSSEVAPPSGVCALDRDALLVSASQYLLSGALECVRRGLRLSDRAKHRGGDVRRLAITFRSASERFDRPTGTMLALKQGLGGVAVVQSTTAVTRVAEATRVCVPADCSGLDVHPGSTEQGTANGGRVEAVAPREICDRRLADRRLQTFILTSTQVNLFASSLDYCRINVVVTISLTRESGRLGQSCLESSGLTELADGTMTPFAP